MKQILVIKTSPRRGGNSDCLADAFIHGAQEAGHQVEEVCLRDKQIAFCRGCWGCLKTHRCVIADDAVAIAEQIYQADVVVWVTPVYYYCCSGQMKTMIDRANPLYNSDYRFQDVYLLATAAEEAQSAVEGTVKAVQGWVDCFERAQLRGVVFAGGVTDKGDIAGAPALDEAYKLGKAVQ